MSHHTTNSIQVANPISAIAPTNPAPDRNHINSVSECMCNSGVRLWERVCQSRGKAHAKSLQHPAWNFPSLQNPASGSQDSRKSYGRGNPPPLSTISRRNQSAVATHGSRARTILPRGRCSDCSTPIRAGASSIISCGTVNSRGGWKLSWLASDQRKSTRQTKLKCRSTGDA